VTEPDRLLAYRRARVLAGGIAVVGFVILAMLEPLAWSLAWAALAFLVVSLVELRDGFRNPNTLVVLDSVVAFGAILVARPFPGGEALALALTMSTAIIFAGRRALRILLPALTAVAALLGLVNWVIRDPVAWSASAMVANAVVMVGALSPVMFWMAGSIARAFPARSAMARLTADPAEFANMVTERSGEGIAIIDSESNIRYANPAFAAIFGYDRGVLLGSSMSLLMDETTYARHHHALQRALLARETIDSANLELIGRHRRGHPVAALVSLTELTGGGERLVLGAVRDVTEMIDLRARLQEMVAAKDRFIATVSHELRTPLTAVVAYSEMLRNREGIDEADQNEFIELIADQSREVSYLIEDLLVAARLDADAVSISVQPTALRGQVMSVLGPWAPQRVVDVDHDALDHTVAADPGRLRQILRNLVSNALKYGGDRVAVTAVTDDEGMCHVIVRDDGPGVSATQEISIFEPYEHGGDVEGQPFSMGLGLHVSRGLAETMGGSLLYRRHDDMTEFVLKLPLASEQLTLTDVGD